MGAGGEDGFEDQQDEAAIGRAGEGRLKRVQDVVDRLGESAADLLELASAQSRLLG